MRLVPWGGHELGLKLRRRPLASHSLADQVLQRRITVEEGRGEPILLGELLHVQARCSRTASDSLAHPRIVRSIPVHRVPGRQRVRHVLRTPRGRVDSSSCAHRIRTLAQGRYDRSIPAVCQRGDRRLHPVCERRVLLDVRRVSRQRRRVTERQSGIERIVGRTRTLLRRPCRHHLEVLRRNRRADPLQDLGEEVVQRLRSGRRGWRSRRRRGWRRLDGARRRL